MEDKQVVEELEGGRNWAKSITISAGGRGTSYSGGSGSGAANSDGNGGRAVTSGAGSSVGGAGGNGVVGSSNSSGYGQISMGGTGNPSGSYATYRESVVNYVGRRGTGGLLIIYSKNLFNGGTISAQGVSSSTASLSNSNGRVDPGGSSGGGSINIFANKVTNLSTITATGGAATRQNTTGGAGGNGTVTIKEVAPDLTCATKQVKLNIKETYSINLNTVELVPKTSTQLDEFTLGNLKCESLNENIAIVDEYGKITAISAGLTKIKITDTKNDISTYVYVEVLSNSNVEVQEGKNFTIALKQNGTVWSYGLNNNGQLGLGDNENRIEPTQIEGLDNIKEISTGYSHSLALTKDGEVYAWGENTNGQLGIDDVGAPSLRPQKIDAISNIIKINAYKNKSIALSNDGKVYVWGEGQSTLPMRLISATKVADISGDLILAQNGLVYNISNLTTPISGLNNIAKISAGINHNLALDVDGVVYAWGTNTYGECGIATTGTTAVRKVTFNIFKISAGNCTSILQSENGSIYVLGNNANGQIGIGSTAKATVATKITLAENVEIENISAGEGTHTGLVDTKGFVWHTGTNTKGELGIENTTSKNIYTKTGNEMIAPNCKDKIYLDIEEEQTIETKLENSFNLKIGIIDDNPENFKIEIASNIVILNGTTIKAKEYGETSMTITHTPTGKTRQIEIIVIPKMESIVQGFRDKDLPDGEYEVYIKDEMYKVELINYYENVRYSLEEGQTSKTISLGDNSTDYKTLVVKYHGDLNIDKGVTLTATTVNNLTYKKGMYICVLGNIYNNGNISMTARGTYNAQGENVYLWKNIDDSMEYVPATGGVGGAAQSTKQYNTTLNGKSGISGTGRQTGGGGTGGRKKLDEFYNNRSRRKRNIILRRKWFRCCKLRWKCWKCGNFRFRFINRGSRRKWSCRFK